MENEEQDGAERAVDAVGVAAVGSGVLLLSPVAIVLGHVGLTKAAKEPTRSRTLPVAGLVLGYAGLVVTVIAVVVYALALGPQLGRATADAQAQADVTAIGNAVVAQVATGGELPAVAVAEGSYGVGDADVAAQLSGDRQVALTGSGRADWCVQLDYQGGDSTTVSYVAADGFHEGDCSQTG